MVRPSYTPNTEDRPRQRRISRRKFLKRTLWAGLGVGVAAAGYPVVETRRLRITRRTVDVPRLPEPFSGMTVAILADIHHGPLVGLGFVRRIVRETNGLAPDVIALVGDYVYRGRRYIEPCGAELARLRARLGVCSVLGNHDHWDGAAEVRSALADANIRRLDNDGVWLEKDGARLRVCGVGDLWEDEQDLDAALGDCRDDETALLLCHNPDYVEGLRDRRVGLVLCGHTHGGQVSIPFVGPPIVPSRYGKKYAAGLVRTPHTQVYVSRGLGTISVPVRFNCRPEIVFLTLRPAA